MNLVLLIPLLLILAILVSVLGSLSGVGGGVLFVPLFLWILPKNSLAEIKFLSTLLVFVSAFINVVFNLIKKNLNVKIAILGLISCLPTIFLGNYLVTLFDPKILKLIIGLILIIVAILLILVEYKFKNLYNEISYSVVALPRSKTLIQVSPLVFISFWKIIIIGAIGGLVTSMTGMGGGPILMPLLLIWGKLSLTKAAPISHSLIAGASLVSLCTNYEFFTQTELMVNNATPMLIGVLIGTFLAIWLKRYIKKEIYIKWILIILILISAIKMIVDYFI